MDAVLRVKKNKYIYKYRVTLEIDEERIYFKSSPFGLKDEIKAMRGAKWHGFDKDNPRKIWSIDNHPRNVFQLYAMMGKDVYSHFDQELMPEVPDFELKKVLAPQQHDMLRACLTYHFQILAAEQGLGKSLVAISLAMIVGGRWWYVGPKSALESVYLELEKWGAPQGTFEKLLTYQGLEKEVKYGNFDAPIGIIFDESSNVKNSTSKRTKWSQYIADCIREKSNNQGYVVLMSGTPTAKSPGDVWSQAEIAFPGFLREGSERAFKDRYAKMEEMQDGDGRTFQKLVGWKEEEIENLSKRLDGLMRVYRKSEWLKLPKKKFRRVRLEPSKKVSRVAKALVNVAPTAATALTWLRALSSGFQYVTEESGEYQECSACKMMPSDYDCPVCDNNRMLATKQKVTKEVKTPKEDALREEIKNQHRVIIAASFRGSIDRCQKIAHSMGFAVSRVDGRGWVSYDKDGNLIKDKHPLRWWSECEGPVAFIGNPGSCKYGITLVEATRMVFFDNDFSAENRLQMIDRFHRMGQTRETEVVDLIHLPVDERVLDVLDSNRSTELISLGELDELVSEGLKDEA